VVARDGAQPALHDSGRGAEQQPAAAQGGRADPVAGSLPGHTSAALSRQWFARGRPGKQAMFSWGVQALSTNGSYTAATWHPRFIVCDRQPATTGWGCRWASHMFAWLASTSRRADNLYQAASVELPA